MREKVLFFLTAETAEAGGLFDFDSTLPLVGFQFLVLMFLLNIILYEPLLTIIHERTDYINQNLTNATNLLLESSEINKNYDIFYTKINKECTSQNLKLIKALQTKTLELLKNTDQKISLLVTERITEFKKYKDYMLNSSDLDKTIKLLRDEIIAKLLP